ncbi:MAG: SDR family oxidoreductase [Betaproteobacteria bacterium]|nr:SDR family oxidoreductase [Betaproteobacteria bacterium]
MDLGIRGRTALITASSNGIGKRCALTLAAEGVRLVLCARGKERLDAAASEAAAIAGADNVLAIPADLALTGDIERLCSEATERFSGIDILIFIGGSPRRGGPDVIDEADLRDAFELTVVPAFTLTRLLLPGMRKRGWGRVVTVQARSVREPIDDLVTSVATRPGVAGLFKYLANEVGGDGVTVNTIVPGRINTDRFRAGAAYAAKLGDATYLKDKVGGIPVGRLGEPQEVADAVCFLASVRASYINGAALQVDGGVIRAI